MTTIQVGHPQRTAFVRAVDFHTIPGGPYRQEIAGGSEQKWFSAEDFCGDSWTTTSASASNFTVRQQVA